MTANIDDAIANCETPPTTTSGPTTPSGPTTTTGGTDVGLEIPYDEALPGDCWTEEAPNVDGFVLQDCAEAHEWEVYATVVLTDGPFPGQDAVESEAYDACLELFEDYVGLDYFNSDFFIDTVRPSESTWADGDRLAICNLTDGSGSSTGSAAGSAR
jgi:hypothetical protein